MANGENSHTVNQHTDRGNAVIGPRGVVSEGGYVLLGALKLPAYSAAMCSGSVAGGWHRSLTSSPP